MTHKHSHIDFFSRARACWNAVGAAKVSTKLRGLWPQASVADAAPEQTAFDAEQLKSWESEGGSEAEPDPTGRSVPHGR